MALALSLYRFVSSVAPKFTISVCADFDTTSSSAIVNLLSCSLLFIRPPDNIANLFVKEANLAKS